MNVNKRDYISDEVKWVEVATTVDSPVDAQVSITFAILKDKDIFIRQCAIVNGSIIDGNPLLKGYSINHDHVIHLPVYDYDRKNLCFHPYHGADVSMVPISRNDLQSFLTLLHPDIASIFRKWFNDAYPNEPRTRSIGSCYMA